MKRFSVLVLLVSLSTQLLSAWEAATKEDEGIFPNPERGFYFFQDLALSPGDWNAVRKEKGISLIGGKVVLEKFREVAVLPDSFVEKVEAGFKKARQSGMKVVVRVNYGHKGPGGDYKTYEDPAKEIILGHIEQLAPVWEKNADVIALFEAGFVGPWGEWHSTTIANEPELQREVYLKIVGNTPKNRMVLLRYPELKRSIFEKREALTEKDAYQTSDWARTGHHNDCFLSSENDVGTYGRGDDDREGEVDYLAQETRFTAYGGETCAVHDFNDAARTLVELDLLNASYLNWSYHPKVLEKWQAQGCYEEVARLLGARFVLCDFDGEKVQLENVGFASLYNERKAYWVLEKEGEIVERIQIAADPRRWKSGVKTELELPAELEGVSRVGLWMPDLAESLREDSRYAIRFANEGCWDEKSGVNWILSR
ncbi:MAG: DUF4832 domain-containing protein [Roseibacillus sp.]